MLAELGEHVPAPSICVGSGRGTHLYWLLTEDQKVGNSKSRDALESLLRNLYREIQSDATQDVSRLLRLPGFDNMKTTPRPCAIVHFHETRRYTLDDFRLWTCEQQNRRRGQPDMESKQGKHKKSCNQTEIVLRHERLANDCLGVPKIRMLLQQLDVNVPDRSRRDFAIVCQLLRMGLTTEQISELVDGHSKFVSRDYTATTIENASRIVHDSK